MYTLNLDDVIYQLYLNKIWGKFCSIYKVSPFPYEHGMWVSVGIDLPSSHPHLLRCFGRVVWTNPIPHVTKFLWGNPLPGPRSIPGTHLLTAGLQVRLCFLLPPLNLLVLVVDLKLLMGFPIAEEGWGFGIKALHALSIQTSVGTLERGMWWASWGLWQRRGEADRGWDEEELPGWTGRLWWKGWFTAMMAQTGLWPSFTFAILFHPSCQHGWVDKKGS